MPSDLRFVFDTNTLVSAVLLKQSIVRRAFDRGWEQGDLLISQATMEELNEVLRRKGFDKYLLEEDRIEFVTALVREAVLVEVDVQVKECRDPKDNKFLELAVSSGAACIVSGDNDLVALNPFRGIPILSPRQFLDRSWGEGSNEK